MLLAIDIGNTNVVLACVEVGRNLFEDRPPIWRLETDAEKNSADYAAAIRDLLGANRCAAVTGAIVASVVPALSTVICDAVASATGHVPLLVGDDGVDLGIDINIDEPEQAGADRLVNAVGAKAHHQLPAIVLDFGTATTLDLVGADGAYEGGIIAPGVALSIDALEATAAQLPRLALREFGADLPILGKNTVSAMESGIFWGYVSMIEGLLARLRADYGDVSMIATGGLAGLFSAHLPGINAVDPDLTVKGLFEIYARNSSAAARAQDG